ncbi:hypothetical protein LR48_Vigan03g180300 [Vigna angularis]|uniref:Uncharacterized protein n=1 Tax=Phaseolus angularis TaxID=3914 RepID=A0A0L9U6M3_PHAAN|nr:hypothetical protein LR48_Vigan03g180300 [Vigna angularis]
MGCHPKYDIFHSLLSLSGVEEVFDYLNLVMEGLDFIAAGPLSKLLNISVLWCKAMCFTFNLALQTANGGQWQQLKVGIFAVTLRQILKCSHQLLDARSNTGVLPKRTNVNENERTPIPNVQGKTNESKPNANSRRERTFTRSTTENRTFTCQAERLMMIVHRKRNAERLNSAKDERSSRTNANARPKAEAMMNERYRANVQQLER